MSNFTKAAYHPTEKVVRAAHYVDDHFGKHQYGVMFDGDHSRVYKPDEVEIPVDVIFVPKQN